MNLVGLCFWRVGSGDAPKPQPLPRNGVLCRTTCVPSPQLGNEEGLASYREKTRDRRESPFACQTKTFSRRETPSAHRGVGFIRPEMGRARRGTAVFLPEIATSRKRRPYVL